MCSDPWFVTLLSVERYSGEMENQESNAGTKGSGCRLSWFSRFLAELFPLNREADMATIEMISGVTNPTKVGIVWRNPNSVHASRRWHSSAPSLGCNRYVLQEYDGYYGLWRTICDWEVVTGGR
jgi:hypothetical protein